MPEICHHQSRQLAKSRNRTQKRKAIGIIYCVMCLAIEFHLFVFSAYCTLQRVVLAFSRSQDLRVPLVLMLLPKDNTDNSSHCTDDNDYNDDGDQNDPPSVAATRVHGEVGAESVCVRRCLFRLDFTTSFFRLRAKRNIVQA